MVHLNPHPELHPLFETLAYTLGFALYKYSRRGTGDVIDDRQRWSVIAAAALGALVGSRVLEFLEQAPKTHWDFSQLLSPNGGKTVVGGLLGGWLCVEIAKKLAGIRMRTGDLFAVPLCVGIAVGRIGCFVAGLADDTYGNPTTLPWAVDFGDGVPRHPTQAYEILFLIALGLVLRSLGKKPQRTGALFRYFMTAYLFWRLVIDFLKPEPSVAGMNLIQWACIAGLVVLLIAALRDNRLERS